MLTEGPLFCHIDEADRLLCVRCRFSGPVLDTVSKPTETSVLVTFAEWSSHGLALKDVANCTACCKGSSPFEVRRATETLVKGCGRTDGHWAWRWRCIEDTNKSPLPSAQVSDGKTWTNVAPSAVHISGNVTLSFKGTVTQVALGEEKSAVRFSPPSSTWSELLICRSLPVPTLRCATLGPTLCSARCTTATGCRRRRSP